MAAPSSAAAPTSDYLPAGVPRPTGTRRLARISHRLPLIPFVVLAALAARLALVATSAGGFGGLLGYDAGVYYAAADALSFGKVPYRDYLLLHPPGLTLTLTPFALLGRLTGDHVGYVVANATFLGLGAVNAGLVAAVARRLGARRRAQLAGGLFYALWYGAAASETSARLEPLGSVLILLALWFATGPRSARRGALLLAGAAAGAAVSVKIWWLVPALVLLGWQLSILRRRAGWFLLGGAGTVGVVLGPWFALAPTAMWRMVVTDQLHRDAHTSFVQRIELLVPVRRYLPGGPLGTAVLVGGVVLLAAVLVAGALRERRARVVLALAVAQVAVLMTTPVFFYYYADYLAAAVALLVALTTGRVGTPGPGRAARLRTAAGTAFVALAGASLGVALAAPPHQLSSPFPAAALRDRLGDTRCVQSDSPAALIALDVLSRDLSNRCTTWVDVTGRTYDVDFVPARPYYVPRVRNPLWQRDIRRYLLSGDAVIVVRPDAGLSPATQRAVLSGPVVARSGGTVVHATP